MSAAKPPRRPRAETPKGFRDYFGPEVTERQEMLAKIAAVYHRYGFEALESSAVETVEALGKFLPDVDRPNVGVFVWNDELLMLCQQYVSPQPPLDSDDFADRLGEMLRNVHGDDWLALRYDLTAPLARVYAQHRNNLPSPYRRYAMGPVWRNEKPGPGRFRQFYQCDADTVGSASPAADAEIVAMLADALEAAGIERGDYVIRINSRKVLNGVLQAIGYGPREYPDDSLDAAIHDAFAKGVAQAIERAQNILRTLDKFDKVGVEGVRQLLGGGRTDSSGARIAGIGLLVEEIDPLIEFLTARSDTSRATLAKLRGAVRGSPVGLEGVEELESMVSLLEAQGYGADRIVVDPSVVRGLGYYTGPVFEAELTFEILDEKGRKRQFGSVAGGGRYDDLVKRFTGQAVPATGVSVGVDRLLAALRAKGRIGGKAEGPVVVTVMDRERMADYFAIVSELRQAGIRAEVYLGNPRNFGNQLKYADARRSPVAIIEGAEEKARDVVQIKDLVAGARIAASASLDEWKARPTQFEVPRADLVAAVQRLLG